MVFCRVGGLSPVNHKNKENKFTFHFPPPSKKGIYAFIWPYIDLFLVLWNDRNKKEFEINKFRKFKYDGPIWCHFESDKIIISKREWFLTNTYDLKNILKKIFKEDRECLMKENFLFVRDPYKSGSCNGFTISRDHLEVYIDKKYLGKIK
jgi:hypothetical protein